MKKYATLEEIEQAAEKALKIYADGLIAWEELGRILSDLSAQKKALHN